MKNITNNRGEGYILPCVLILIVATFFSVVYTYTSVISVVEVSRENSKVVLDSFVTTNSTVIFESIKQGNNFTEAVNSDDFCTSLIGFCTLDEDGELLYSYDSEGNEKYSITVPQMSYREENELEITVRYTLFVPIRFAGSTVTTAHIPIEIASVLTEKF